MKPSEYLAQDFGQLDELVRLHAKDRPSRVAMICEDRRVSYAEIDALANRAASALQREGIRPKDVVAICAASSIEYVALFIATLRAGATVAPLPSSVTPEQLRIMIADCRPTHFFVDDEVSTGLEGELGDVTTIRVSLGNREQHDVFDQWLAPPDATPMPVPSDPTRAFNIIYSSGTTGTPKGIIHSHQMRWFHILRFLPISYGPEAVVLLSTPLYSNTTLVALLPALASGSTTILMAKFDVRRYLELCQSHRVTTTMLVPVQYRRILGLPEFGDFDLTSFQMKFSTSAPFPSELKYEVLTRWPGGLTELYGMTEGGVSCVLRAHEHPDKLHTVGTWSSTAELMVIDDEGRAVSRGIPGEIIGRSTAMMEGYLNLPEKTAELEWWSPDGVRYLRTGDIGSVDEDGFVTIIGRKKEMIISGGFNIYPVDLEAALVSHPAVDEAAVIAKPSERWGETPVAFVTLNKGVECDTEQLRNFANESLGKFQRIAEVHVIDELPRNAIGKVMRRDLQLRLVESS